MALELQIRHILEPAFNHLGYDLVQVTLGGGQNMRLQLIIDRLDETTVTIDDCVKANREASALLDVEDPIKGEYTLEVSSPGFDRPLVRPKDYIRFQGQNIKLETTEPVNGRKRYKGLLQQADESSIALVLVDTQEVVNLSYEQISRAKVDPVY